MKRRLQVGNILTATITTAALLIQAIAPASAEITTITSGTRTLTGRRDLSSPRSINVPAGLAAFSLNFANGDHQIKEITVLQNGPTGASVNLQDNDGNDPYRARLSYEDDLGVRIGQPGVTVNFLRSQIPCRGTCRVPIPGDLRDVARSVLILTGFSFQFQDGDRHIRKIALRRIGNELEVSFGDDTPDDPFNWSVQYVLVPSRLVSQVILPPKNNPNGNITLLPGRRIPRRSVLRGFSFEFTNSDHHLKDFKIDLLNNSASFQDNNLDDPVRWSVDFAILR